MSINERIEEQLNGHQILLYMKGTPYFPQCGFSSKVVQILQACETEFAYVNIFDDDEIREGLKVYSNWPTFPQLYINAELVGGADILIEMFENGELKTLLDGVKSTELAE
ncbi:MAG TPA: Grx4 family monothiol glutaredoxin [Cycloclasticus sp.]|jgi:monothiol glutaredoxin|nr:Grx4 family monothiol glutaredoxin [Cycloclasticus sp.]HIL91717.1 Grx4 family monothiol glutaredoxin [Cycloclasticus sp.]